jgi:hypothetical protein
MNLFFGCDLFRIPPFFAIEAELKLSLFICLKPAWSFENQFQFVGLKLPKNSSNVSQPTGIKIKWIKI